MNLRYKLEKEDIARINRELEARAMDTGASNHFRNSVASDGTYTVNRCACGLVFDDHGLLTQHIHAANAEDESRGEGRQKYGLIKVGDCKVSVRFDFDGNLVINAHTKSAGRPVRVKFGTDADSLSIAP